MAVALAHMGLECELNMYIIYIFIQRLVVYLNILIYAYTVVENKSNQKKNNYSELKVSGRIVLKSLL